MIIILIKMITNNYPSRAPAVLQTRSVWWCIIPARSHFFSTEIQNKGLEGQIKRWSVSTVVGPMVLGCFQAQEQGAWIHYVAIGPQTRVWCPSSSRCVIHWAECAENSGKLWNWRVTNNKRHRDSDRREWPSFLTSVWERAILLQRKQ